VIVVDDALAEALPGEHRPLPPGEHVPAAVELRAEVEGAGVEGDPVEPDQAAAVVRDHRSVLAWTRLDAQEEITLVDARIAAGHLDARGLEAGLGIEVLDPWRRSARVVDLGGEPRLILGRRLSDLELHVPVAAGADQVGIRRDGDRLARLEGLRGQEARALPVRV